MGHHRIQESKEKKMMGKILRHVVLMAVCIIVAAPVRAGETLTVGVAANFMAPFKELTTLYQKKTGVQINGVYTSTGNLYGQIKNGAPYDLFLAADEKRPEKLFSEGLCDPPFVYARGRLILWSLNAAVCGAATWQDAVLLTSVKKIAIANPETAPYGASAMTAMEKAGLWDRLKPKVVVGQNIAQVFQYAHTQAVDAGFCALSARYTPEGGKGCTFSVPEAPPIVQGGCVLKSSTHPEAIRDFVRFLEGPEVLALKKKFGYE